MLYLIRGDAVTVPYRDNGLILHSHLDGVVAGYSLEQIDPGTPGDRIWGRYAGVETHAMVWASWASPE